jgi:hypothetical protein
LEALGNTAGLTLGQSRTKRASRGRRRIKGLLSSTLLAMTLGGAAYADEPLKIGMITTLSGPAGYLGPANK